MLGFPLLYLKGMRIMMFQLSGFYCIYIYSYLYTYIHALVRSDLYMALRKHTRPANSVRPLRLSRPFIVKLTAYSHTSVPKTGLLDHFWAFRFLRPEPVGLQ